MKSFKICVLISIVMLFISGCASSKSEFALIDKSKMTNEALIIGSFSRNLGNNYIHKTSFDIVTLNHDFVKRVFDAAGETLSLANNPYSFENDFVYETSQGSIFSTMIPEGTYYITNYLAGKGSGGFIGNYEQKVSVKAGDIVYIGDIKFEPILRTHPLYDNKKNIVSTNCIISNQLDRDFNYFKNKYKIDSFKKENIKVLVEEKKFNLGAFQTNGSPFIIFVPTL
ncbi:MAG: hypothetical protein C0626_07100 [Arcobacter sp.]|uniref:hypothetical protein n=1 Tax=uncultured Arcobacter sp. TaxID=165434 RepID=UPI000CB71F5D|nr:hypothetical protein [uncultured Arcobacter sp.]PLY10038.1 MAG: hypothetical protein C0626_07100 [Arcobacter sp.]